MAKAKKERRTMSPRTGGPGAILALFLSLFGGAFSAGAEPPRAEFAGSLAGMDRVVYVAFSSDGRTLLTGSLTNSLDLWEVATRRSRASLRGHPDCTGVALSPDGKTLATTGLDKTVRLWDLITEKSTMSKELQSDSVKDMTFSPDGTILAIGHRKGALTLLSTPDGAHLTTLQGKKDIKRVAFSPDGRILAAADSQSVEPASGVVRLWDVAGWRRRDTFGRDLGVVLKTLAFSPDGKTLVTTDHKRKISLWDTATGELRTHWRSEKEDIGEVRFSPDGRVLVAPVAPVGFERLPGLPLPPEPGRVKFWDTASGKEIFTLKQAHKSPGPAALSPDGRLLAVVCESCDTVNLWDVSAITGKPPGTLPPLPPDKRDGDVARAPDRAEKLTVKDLERLWSDLAGEDAKAAWKAIWTLVASPQLAVAFLGKQLRPASEPEPRQVERLLADLDSDDPPLRQKAAEEWKGLGELAAPALRKELEKPRSAEVRKQVEQLLKDVKQGVPPSDQLQALRAVEVLEHAGTPAAQRLLRKLAEGYPEARLTREARASVERLSRRPAPEGVQQGKKPK